MSSRNRLARLEDSFLPLPPPLSPSFSRFLFFDVMAHVDALRAKIEGLQVRAAPPPPPPPPKRDRGKKEPRGATIGRRSSRLTFVSSPSVPLSHLSLSLFLSSARAQAGRDTCGLQRSSGCCGGGRTRRPLLALLRPDAHRGGAAPRLARRERRGQPLARRHGAHRRGLGPHGARGPRRRPGVRRAQRRELPGSAAGGAPGRGRRRVCRRAGGEGFPAALALWLLPRRCRRRCCSSFARRGGGGGGDAEGRVPDGGLPPRLGRRRPLEAARPREAAPGPRGGPPREADAARRAQGHEARPPRPLRQREGRVPAGREGQAHARAPARRRAPAAADRDVRRRRAAPLLPRRGRARVLPVPGLPLRGQPPDHGERLRGRRGDVPGDDAAAEGGRGGEEGGRGRRGCCCRRRRCRCCGCGCGCSRCCCRRSCCRREGSARRLRPRALRRGNRRPGGLRRGVWGQGPGAEGGEGAQGGGRSCRRSAERGEFCHFFFPLSILSFSQQ